MDFISALASVGMFVVQIGVFTKEESVESFHHHHHHHNRFLSNQGVDARVCLENDNLSDHPSYFVPSRFVNHYFWQVEFAI
jgi:hypothetical protein